MQCLLDHGIKTAIELWSTEQAILVSQEKELLLLEATPRQFHQEREREGGYT